MNTPRRNPSPFRRIARASACVVIAIGVTVVPSFVNAETDDAESARELRQRGAILPLEQIVEAAQKLHQGRLIGTELETRNDGHHVYEVEILDRDGTVWELRFDAATGVFLQQQREE